MLIRFLTIFIFLFTLHAGAQKELKQIEIMVEDAADPWSRRDGKGIANDTVVAAFQEMGVNVALQVVPYARCKAAAVNGKVAACFSMSWLPEFKGLIKLSSHPLIFLNSDVFENVDRPLPKPPKGKCQLPAGTKVGIVNEYEYPPNTMKLGREGAIFIITRSDTQNLQMLSLSRLDASIVITNDLQPRNKKAAEAKVEKSVRFAFNCGHETGTIGFSLKHPDGKSAYHLFEEGYRRLQQKGTLRQIRNSWFPKRPSL